MSAGGTAAAGMFGMQAQQRTIRASEAEREAERTAAAQCTDRRKLSSMLVKAVKANRVDLDILLNAGADPNLRPYHDGSTVLFPERVPHTALDHAAFRGNIEAVKQLLVPCTGALTAEEQSKVVEMAAFSRDMGTLQHVTERFGRECSLAHAFAYCINQGFTQGALYLYRQGAMNHVSSWYRLAQKFRPFVLHYTNLTGVPSFDTGDDFYTYIFKMQGIDDVLSAEGSRAATDALRRDTLTALGEAGFLTRETYREFAVRALIFDEMSLLAHLDEVSGFSFQEEFASHTQAQVEAWIRPRISKEKANLIASMLPPGFSFPFNPRYLTSPQDVKAVLPHVTAATCEHPEMLVEYLVVMGLPDQLGQVKDWGGITRDNVDGLIEEAQRRFQTKAVALLVEYKQEHFADDAMQELLDAAGAL